MQADRSRRSAGVTAVAAPPARWSAGQSVSPISKCAGHLGAPGRLLRARDTGAAGPPVWVGELYLELHRATLTSQHGTKQGNRRSERLLLEAELWCATAAARTGYEYPHDALDELWQQTLLHQFHDILPGTSIAWVHREAVATYARIAERLQEIIAGALTALVGQGDVPLLVNGAGWGRNGVASGAVIPAAERAAAQPVSLREHDGGYVLANDRVEIRVDEHGLVVSAVDLVSGRQAIAPGGSGNLLQLHQDFPNMWDAWDVDRFYRNRVEDLTDVESLTAEVDDDGTARVVVRRSFSSSAVVQELSLAPGSTTLLIDQEVDWHETEKFLKLAFPLDIQAEHTAAETQFGVVKRVTHTNTSWEAAKFETSMHSFVQVEDSGFGVALINDSVHGFDVSRDAQDGRVTTTLRLSLLRAPRFPDPETDQGRQTHRFGLVVGASLADATREGALLNTDARQITGAHGVEPLVRVSGDVVLGAVKLADDRSGDLIVRVYEPVGRRGSGTIAVDVPFRQAFEVDLLEDQDPSVPNLVMTDDGAVDLDVLPFQVRTFRFALGRP